MTIHTLIVNTSSDDGEWNVETDLRGVRSFLTDPRSFVKTHGAVTLRSPYNVQIHYRKAPGEYGVRITAKLHNDGSELSTALIDIYVDPMLLMPEFRDLNSRMGSMTPIWDQVALDFPDSKIDMTYRRPTAPGAGFASAHHHLNNTRSAIVKFIEAVVFEAAGLGTWLQGLPITKRQEALADGTNVPLLRPSGTKEYFSSGRLPLRILIAGMEPASGPCRPGEVLIACNEDNGLFRGDPTMKDSDIEVDVVMIKWYCAPGP